MRHPSVAEFSLWGVRCESASLRSNSLLIRDVLSHAVTLYPDRVALVDGERRLTYRETSERVHRLASALLDLGLRPNDHIAVLANNSLQYWETYYVADAAGMPLAPLNTRLAAKELEFILNDCDVKALFLGPEFVTLYEEFRAAVPGLQHVIAMGGPAADDMHEYESLVSRAEPLAKSVREWAEDDMVNICYTGGTTGLPKGVMLTHRNVVSNAQHAIVFSKFDENDAWLHVAPMFHLADAWAVYAITLVGGMHVFVPAFSPAATLDAIQRHRVTKTLLVPTMINMIVNWPDTHSYDVSTLDLLIYGASPMPVDRLLGAVKIFGPILIQAYGQTESSPFLTIWNKSWLKFDGNDTEIHRLQSCGRQVGGVRVRVVNANDEDVTAGEFGEVIARGPNIMKGYWNRPNETAAALRGGWLRTGDVATIDEDNFVYIVDRAKDMIISGGENIYSTEVENAIFEHSAVLEAAVIGIPDERWGEAVLAIVVTKEGMSVSPDEIIEHTRRLIASYKVPKQVIVRSEPLPKSGPGKVLKTELRKPFWGEQAKNVN